MIGLDQPDVEALTAARAIQRILDARLDIIVQQAISMVTIGATALMTAFNLARWWLQ